MFITTKKKKDRGGFSFTELLTAFALSYKATTTTRFSRVQLRPLKKQAGGCSSITIFLIHVPPDQEVRERHVGVIGLCLLQTSHIATVCELKYI